ncbi:MAG: BMP family ABC transporter substrate-binding protein [Lachnospiraceae bacterium]|nr:BMP family ABC transporter substrate-binding protein [Lachnospiraceae bacterium]
MKGERKLIVWVLIAAMISIYALYMYRYMDAWVGTTGKVITVGIVLDGDESTPYSGNFIRAMESLKVEYGDSVRIIQRSNVPYEEVDAVLRDLINRGCDIIFTNSYGYSFTVKDIAAEFPSVQFCQATGDNADDDPVLGNYHTFMGSIYQGRYIAGLVAGLKMQELINSGIIAPDEAIIGYVGAYPYPEVISGYTAFFLGARQNCPTAVMRVRYSYTWTSYMKEKELAEQLIDEGCVVISQHSDTIGPAVSCENARTDHPVFHVGYNQDMIDVAPTTSLIGTRINWTPYIVQAVKAVMNDQKIENVVMGNVHVMDVGAGFDRGWVEMLELNPAIAPNGAQEVIDRTIEDMTRGNCHVFHGNYIGVNPDDPSDTWNLNVEYIENSSSSAPTFYYILQDVITIEE